MISQRKRFRDVLSTTGMTLAPGAYDALSARIIEAQGFDAVFAGGYAAIASLLAEPDMGQCNVGDYADHYARISAAVSLPVFVDGDTGFGGVHNVRQMTRRFEAAGVAGFFFSDQVFPNRCGYMAGAGLVSPQEMTGHIKAALDARQDPDLYIVARTDALRITGLDDAIARAQLYMEAGADATLVIGTDAIDDYKRVRAAVPGVQIANISHANAKGSAPLSAYERAGAELAIFPSAALFAAAGAVHRALGALKSEGSFKSVEADFMQLPEFYDLVAFDRLQNLEQVYLGGEVQAPSKED